MASQYIRYPAASSSGGVSSLNGETGAVNIVAGSGITVTPSGQNITIAATGGGGANTSLSNLSAVAFNADLLPGTNNTLKIGDATHKILSLDVTTISNSGQPVINVNSFTMLDSSGSISVDFGARQLDDASGSISIDWLNRQAQDSSSILSIDYQARLLTDSSAADSVAWQSRNLRDSSGTNSVKWGSRALADSAGANIANWNTPAALDFENTSSIINLVNPVNPQDAATKSYVDSSASGTVTSVSVVSANGLAGTVATATTTPAITLSTTIIGILQGDGTAISAATTGNLTDSGTDGIVITSGTGAVLGSGTSIAQHVSDATHNGYLSSTDWSIFNSKQATVTIGSFNNTSTANGLDITANAISLHAASATNPGAVSTGTQTFAGAKTFPANFAITGSSLTALTLNSTSFIFDTTNNALGIGVAPAAATFVEGINSTGSAKRFVLTGYGTGSTVGYRGRFARGTSGSPTAAQNGDILNFISGQGYGATTFPAASTGTLNFVAGETFTDSSNLTYFNVQTTPTGSVTAAESFRVASTGVTLGPQSSSTAVHSINGGIVYTTRTITANLTIDTTTKDYIILCNQSGAINVTLPAPSNGRVLIIKDISGTANTNNITLVRNGSESIEGIAASKILQTNWGAWTFTSDGTNWFML